MEQMTASSQKDAVGYKKKEAMARLITLFNQKAFGIPVITLGVYLINKEKKFDWGGVYGHSVYTLGIGVYLMFSGILGFFGALKRKNRWLIVYSVAMATLCVVEMIMGVVNYIYGSENAYDLRSHLNQVHNTAEVDSNVVIDKIKDVYNDPYFSVLYDAATGEYNVFNIITLLTGTGIFQLWIAEMAFVYTCINNDETEY
ncbi:hypothetical protein ACTXT7_010069 [Hymenolepis weldensis]